MNAGASANPLPTVPEADAAGAIAALYADVRATLGVPVVNLIWRHLATVPGGLAWAWASVRPLYAAGHAARAAAEIRAGLPLPAPARFSADETATARLAGEDGETVARILESYARGNGANLVALSALALAARGETAPEPPPAGADAPAPALAPIPPIPPVEGAAATRVARLNRLGALDGGALTASLYRHLAYWPGFLDLLHERLAPIAADGTLARLRDAVAADAEVRARALLGALAPAPAPPAQAHQAVVAAVERFRVNMIARMVVVGALTERMMPERG